MMNLTQMRDKQLVALARKIVKARGFRMVIVGNESRQWLLRFVSENQGKEK